MATLETRDLPNILRKKADVLAFCKQRPDWILEWCLGVGHSWYWLRHPTGAHEAIVKVDKRALPSAFMACYFQKTKGDWRSTEFRFMP